MPFEGHVHLSCAQGDHLCVLYESDDELIAVSAAYLAEGLQRGERCLFVARDKELLRRCREALARHGVDVETAWRSGAYVDATNADVHLAHGEFNAERMLGFLNRTLEAALDDGFTGLRTCGDMSWLLDAPHGTEQAIEYEGLLNPFFQGVRGIGMCLYDARRLPPSTLHAALETHTFAVVDGSQHRSLAGAAIAAHARRDREELERQLDAVRRQPTR